MSDQAVKSGYLHQDFRIFYNADSLKKTFPLHYHDFHKLMLFLGGNAGYIIEGRQYDLQPLDLVLVPAGWLHRPLIYDESLYERVIVYLSDEYFREMSTRGTDLFACFRAGQEKGSCLIRPSGQDAARLREQVPSLTRCAEDDGFGAGLLRQALVAELLILINRMVLNRESTFAMEAASNPVVLEVMDYINTHLTDEDLSVDSVAKHALLGRSYLMHLFKAETGYTLGRYITEKRLFLACACLEKGLSVTEACYQSGFGNYSTFYYAYRKKYGVSPNRKRYEQLVSEGE